MTTLPSDPESERALIGSMFVLPEHVADIRRMVLAEDFAIGFNQAVFSAVGELYESGEPITVLSVIDALEPSWQDAKARLAAIETEATAAWKRAARAVVRTAVARKLLLIAEHATESINAKVNPLEVLDTLKAGLAAIDVPTEGLPANLYDFEQFPATCPADAPWLVDGLVRHLWRIIVVAEEGSGKSYLARQIALCSAAGIHPLNFQPMPPVATLMVDLENPADVVADGARAVLDPLAKVRRAEGGAWLWHMPSGVDLRTRKARSQFETVLAHCRPQLVCMGPVYKMYTAMAREKDELVVGEVQAVLDDLRGRYGFALILEHHAPHGPAKDRQMRPFGSSLWLRWPEFGIALRRDPNDKTALNVGRWRGDRVKASWPDRLVRGKTWPWNGRWDDDL